MDKIGACPAAARSRGSSTNEWGALFEEAFFHGVRAADEVWDIRRGAVFQIGEGAADEAGEEATGGAYSSADALWLSPHAGLSCNVVSLPKQRAVLAQLVHDSDDSTRNLLTEAANERNLSIEFVQQTEAAKCDGALTCCSVLLDI